MTANLKMKATDIEIDIIIDDTLCPQFDDERLRRMIKATCADFRVHRACISIFIGNDVKICKLHKQFIGAGRTTDVMSFDLTENGSEERIFDIAVNAQMALRKAEEEKTDSADELALYILHGLLHCLGFEDKNDNEFAAMHRLEDRILRKFGYGDVYSSAKSVQKPVAKKVEKYKTVEN